MMGESNIVVVRKVVELPDQFDRLLLEAEAEGRKMITMLQNEWRSGTNRFERPGEILAIATVNDEIADIGGTTQDFMDSS